MSFRGPVDLIIEAARDHRHFRGMSVAQREACAGGSSDGASLARKSEHIRREVTTHSTSCFTSPQFINNYPACVGTTGLPRFVHAPPVQPFEQRRYFRPLTDASRRPPVDRVRGPPPESRPQTQSRSLLRSGPDRTRRRSRFRAIIAATKPVCRAIAPCGSGRKLWTHVRDESAGGRALLFT